MLFLALLLFPGLQAQGPASIPGLKIEPVSRELLQEIKERPMATREELAGSYRILPGASFARLRMEPSGNGPSLVRVLVGGIEEPLLLDTGSPMTAVTAETAVRAGVRLRTRDGQMGHFPWAALPFYHGFLEELRLGEVILRNVPVEVMARRVFANGKEIRGVLGVNVLRHFLLRFPPGQNEVALERPSPALAKALASVPSAPFDWGSQGKMGFQARLDEKGPYWFFLDTGLGRDIFFLTEKMGRIVEARHFIPDLRHLSDVSADFTLSSVRLGGIRLSGVRAQAAGPWFQLGDFQGILGSGVFKQGTLILDLPGKRILWQAPPGPTPDSPPEKNEKP